MFAASRRAFTLVETMTVIAIVLVLAGIGFSVLQPSKESSRKLACLTNLTQLRSALLLYESDQGGSQPEKGPLPFYPATSGYLALRQSYIKSPEVLFCPTLPRSERGPLAMTTFSYLDLEFLTADEPAARHFRETFEAHGLSMPALYCPVHDDLIHRFEEQNVHPDFAHPIYVEVRFDGSLHKGRSVLKRTQQPTFPFKGLQ
jgi:prepilin-type N-terminal cleavage/methylation domain-containing protein